MKKLKIVLLCISLIIYRWVSLESPLPRSWTPNMETRITAEILDPVEYTDTKTIIKNGIWEFQLKGYAAIIPGATYVFTGRAQPKVLLNKVTKIVVKNPTFEVIKLNDCQNAIHSRCVRLWMNSLRDKWVVILEKTLPEPMSSLAAGILLGVKRGMPQDFYQSLVSTGTLHIIAASGYNVTIVAQVIMNLLIVVLSRKYAVLGGIVGIFVYIILAGFSASVARAGIMATLTLLSFYFGRPTEAKRLLWITVLGMALIKPLLIVDVGFQLSVGATIGMLYLEPMIKRVIIKVLSRISIVQAYMAEYLSPSLAASIPTLPVILWYFGRLSWISPLVNILVLPVIPLIMFLSAAIILAGSLSLALAKILAMFLYPPLYWMVWVIRWFG